MSTKNKKVMPTKNPTCKTMILDVFKNAGKKSMTIVKIISEIETVVQYTNTYGNLNLTKNVGETRKDPLLFQTKIKVRFKLNCLIYTGKFMFS